MKYILFNIKDEKNRILTRDVNIDEKNKITEIIIGQEKIRNILESKNKYINHIRKTYFEYKIKQKINNILNLNGLNNEKWCYILSKEINNNEEEKRYLKTLLEQYGGKNYVVNNEMDTNIHKYIEDYLRKNNLESHEIKVLFVNKEINSINFNLLKESIKRYRVVDIYTPCKVNEWVLDKISNINQIEGSSIEIKKYNKKAFLQYNVVYFANDIRENYPRIRIDKNALVIDETVAQNDIFNTDVILYNKLSLKVKELDVLKSQYEVLSLAGIVRKIVN